MSSASEEVQILVENSDSVSTDQEDTELHEDGRSNDKVRKANIKTKEVPSSIDESELLNVSYMYNIPSEYNLVHPSKYMRADEALDSESLMLYAEDFRSRAINAMTVSYQRARTLKGKIAEMEHIPRRREGSSYYYSDLRGGVARDPPIA
ncbi:hypothetical protein JCGZ_06652 [Jatropha curcas]|uniref:Uncharacterized protein n=1 Tax=Jatropha curcas TaxID=180498 RepID=A0A067LCC8_JATCU|nr:hypothetical protein JCGZ_06652 [Jatropha curcas]